MAVSEQTPYIEYTANGVATSFALGFDCESKDHLIVTLDGVEPPVGDWSLTDGVVVFTTAPSNGVLVVIQRNTPFSRTTDYQSYNNSFRPPVINNDFDRVWWKIQELGVRDWLLDLKIQKFRDDVNLTALENTLEEAKQIRDDTADSVVEVQSNVAQSQSLLTDTTNQANLAQGYASSANSANAAAQQAVIDVSTAEADVYSALSAQQIAVNNSLTAIAGGHKAYTTLALAQADQANLPANTAIEVTNDGANNGTYQWDGTTLTKSDYDPLTQAKGYVDSAPPKTQMLPISTLAGLREDRYVSAAAFKYAYDQLEMLYKSELLSLNSELAKLKLQLANIESIGNATSAKLDSYRAGIVKADYYLSDFGSDTNAGTFEQPFRSFAPLLAMSSGALNNKIIALRCGSSFAPMDIAFLNANNCLITSYGNIAEGRPFIDCTAPVVEAWTEHATGVWKATFTHNGDVKIYPNFFKNGVPVQKVISIAALASASDNAVYADNQTVGTFTAYMKSSVNPATDGNTYRWSKYGSAITLIGTDSTIDNIYAFGNAHQDGALVVKTTDASGGCKLSRCRVDWGNRHSALVGSGTRQSVAEFNEFYGGADDVETGNVLNAGGGANAIVFNSSDHQTATCIDRYNVYDGLTRPNYNTPASLTYFTGGYGHDAVETRPMLKYIAYGNIYKNVESCHSCCAITGEFNDCSFDNVSQVFSADDANTNYTLSNSKGSFEQLVRGTNLNITLLWKDNEIVVNDLARGNAGFVRYAEGTGSINITYDGGTLDVRGVRSSTAPANRVINRVKNGSLKVNGLTVLPIMATPFTYFTDVISGGTFTLDATSGNNKYPIGAVFRVNSTEYNLASWIAAGYEQATSKRHDLPPSKLKDDFARVDNLAVDDVYVQKGGVTTSLALRSGKLATLNGSTQAVALGELDSQDVWARKITQSTVGSSGIALLVENDSNFIIARETSSQYQLQVCNSGAFETKNGSGVTPTVGQEVIAVIKTVIDPQTKVSSKRAWLIADNRNVLQNEQITMPATMVNTKTVGFVGRGAANPLLSDASWGIV